MAQAIRPVMLVILDGFGWREEAADNAVRQARKPNFDRLWQNCPHAFLRTSGSDVGLPDGQMGNSEVGHLNIGAGRVVMQELPRIGQAAKDGSLAKAAALTDLINRLKASGGTCHLLGLMSPGGVHSHQDHAVALAKILHEAGVSTVGARLHRRPRYAAALGRRRPDLARRRAAAGCAGRHGDRPLLRDGPRQALGPRRQGLCRTGRRRRRALRRSASRRSAMPMRTT